MGEEEAGKSQSLSRKGKEGSKLGRGGTHRIAILQQHPSGETCNASGTDADRPRRIQNPTLTSGDCTCTALVFLFLLVLRLVAGRLFALRKGVAARGVADGYVPLPSHNLDRAIDIRHFEFRPA